MYTMPIARVGDDRIIYEKELTISNTAYTSGDNIGELMEISNATNNADDNGVIETIEIIEYCSSGSLQKTATNIYFQKTTFASGNDNAAFNLVKPTTITDAIGITGLAATDYTDIILSDGSLTIGRKAVNVPFVNATDTTLYARLIAAATPTYSSAHKVFVRLYIKRN